MLRFAGIVALFVLAACGSQPSASAPASPSPLIAQGNWNVNLTFKGDVAGQMNGITPDTDTQQSTCSGAKARNGDVWADSFYGTIDSSGQVWQLTIAVQNFRGPGTYTAGAVNVALQSPDNTRAWLNQQGDKITFTIQRSMQSGSIDATLTNAASGKVGSERITGQWNCRG